MMVTAEGASSRRHGRRARALDEDSAQHRPTGDLAFFARRAVVDLPPADAPRPESPRFDLAPVTRVALREREEEPTPAVVAEPHTDVMPLAPAATHDAQAPETSAAPAEGEVTNTGLPGSDRGAKKSSWLSGMWGTSSAPTDTEADGAEARPAAPESEPELGENAQLGEGEPEAEQSPAGSPTDERDGAPTPSAAPAKAGAAAGSVAAAIAGTRMREEDRTGAESSDWYEVGDLPADQAPDPKPAPRFEGHVLNRPSRTATGLGGWLTWLVVAIVLILLIVLLVTGVIGPGLLNSMPATPTYSLLNSGGFIS